MVKGKKYVESKPICIDIFMVYKNNDGTIVVLNCFCTDVGKKLCLLHIEIMGFSHATDDYNLCLSDTRDAGITFLRPATIQYQKTVGFYSSKCNVFESDFLV